MNKTTEKLRILFLFAHLNKGGMQRAVSNISQALPDVFEQFVGFYGTENPPFIYKASLCDFNIPGSTELGFVKKLINFIRRLIKLRCFVKVNKIDVVLSFGEAANFLNIISHHEGKKILGVRSAIGGFGISSIYNKIYMYILRLVYPLADKIITVSMDLKYQIMDLIGNKEIIYNIPNLYDLQKIIEQANEPIPNKYSWLMNSSYILSVGSMITQKGQDLLIAAFSEICKNFPNLLLVLIGSGNDRDKFIDLTVQLGISDRVIFIEFDANPYKYMKCAKIFVLPSLSEGFPNVLIEAMACSCPVVAFDCKTGPKEILDKSIYGELIQNINANALAEKLNFLLSTPQRLEYLKKQSVLRSEYYNASHIIPQWVDVITKVL